MKFTNDTLLRSGFAAVAAAVAALIVVSGYHPCDGTGRLLVFPGIVAAIAVIAGLPKLRARGLLLPGAVATTVLAFAMGLDYSSSGAVSPDGVQCEPVEGFAGFLLAAFFSTVMGGIGLLGVALIVWAARETLRWRGRARVAGDQARSTGTP
jgi:hypothetical protein